MNTTKAAATGTDPSASASIPSSRPKATAQRQKTKKHDSPPACEELNASTVNKQLNQALDHGAHKLVKEFGRQLASKALLPGARKPWPRPTQSQARPRRSPPLE